MILAGQQRLTIIQHVLKNILFSLEPSGLVKFSFLRVRLLKCLLVVPLLSSRIVCNVIVLYFGQSFLHVDQSATSFPVAIESPQLGEVFVNLSCVVLRAARVSTVHVILLKVEDL